MLVTRTDWTDWYVDGDRSAVFVDGDVLVLSELATAVLHHVGDDGIQLGALADGLAADFGAPEDGDLLGATGAVVDELVARGVLVADGAP